MKNHKGFRSYRFEASHYEKLPESVMPIDEQIEVFGKSIHPHGHNYKLVLGIQGELNSKTSMIVELGGLDWIVKQFIINIFDHQDIRDLLEIETPPTNEWFLEHCYFRLMHHKLIADHFSHLYLYDTKTSCAHIKKGDGMIYKTNSFEFTAKHKLWNEQLSTEDNIEAFGKCVRGHGHNYTLKITIKGNPNPLTNLLLVEHAWQKEIEDFLLYYDYSTINELPDFEDKVATTEVFIEHLWDKLKVVLFGFVNEDSSLFKYQGRHIELHSITLQETNRNIFTYSEDSK